MVAGPGERRGHDGGKTRRPGILGIEGKAVGMDVFDHGDFLGRGLEVLTHDEDIHAGAAQLGVGFPQLLPGLPEPQKDRGFCDGYSEFPGLNKGFQAFFEAGPGVPHALEPTHRFHIVGQHMGLCGGDERTFASSRST